MLSLAQTVLSVGIGYCRSASGSLTSILLRCILSCLPTDASRESPSCKSAVGVDEELSPRRPRRPRVNRVRYHTSETGQGVTELPLHLQSRFIIMFLTHQRQTHQSRYFEDIRLCPVPAETRQKRKQVHKTVQISTSILKNIFILLLYFFTVKQVKLLNHACA